MFVLILKKTHRNWCKGNPIQFFFFFGITIFRFTYLFSCCSLSLSLQFVQGNVSLYITHSLNMSSMTIPGLMTILGTAIILLPLAQFMIRKVGKKTTLTIGVFVCEIKIQNSCILPFFVMDWKKNIVIHN